MFIHFAIDPAECIFEMSPSNGLTPGGGVFDNDLESGYAKAGLDYQEQYINYLVSIKKH